MKESIPIDIDGLPSVCPACDSFDLCIDNIDGMECMECMECMDCGCWFTTDDEGNVLWGYFNRPTIL